MADLRISDAVKTTGSGIAKWNETDEWGALEGNVYTLPWIKESTLKDITDEVEMESEGENVFYDTGKRVVEWEMTFMQRDKAAVQWSIETMRGKRVSVFKQASDKPINGYYEYYLAPICKVMSAIELKSKGAEFNVKFRLEAVGADSSSGGTLVVDCSRFTGTFKKAITGSLTFSNTGKQYWDILQIAE